MDVLDGEGGDERNEEEIRRVRDSLTTIFTPLAVQRKLSLS